VREVEATSRPAAEDRSTPEPGFTLGVIALGLAALARTRREG